MPRQLQRGVVLVLTASLLLASAASAHEVQTSNVVTWSTTTPNGTIICTSTRAHFAHDYALAVQRALKDPFCVNEWWLGISNYVRADAQLVVNGQVCRSYQGYQLNGPLFSYVQRYVFGSCGNPVIQSNAQAKGGMAVFGLGWVPGYEPPQFAIHNP